MASQQAGGRRVNADDEMVAVVYLSSNNGMVREYNNDVKSSLEKTDVKINVWRRRSQVSLLDSYPFLPVKMYLESHGIFPLANSSCSSSKPMNRMATPPPPPRIHPKMQK